MGKRGHGGGRVLGGRAGLWTVQQGIEFGFLVENNVLADMRWWISSQNMRTRRKEFERIRV
jgi:hypothetical protein